LNKISQKIFLRQDDAATKMTIERSKPFC